VKIRIIESLIYQGRIQTNVKVVMSQDQIV